MKYAHHGTSSSNYCKICFWKYFIVFETFGMILWKVIFIIILIVNYFNDWLLFVVSFSFPVLIVKYLMNCSFRNTSIRLWRKMHFKLISLILYLWREFGILIHIWCLSEISDSNLDLEKSDINLSINIPENWRNK